jgi:putative hydrolase of the HAD superfamily
MPLHTCPDMTVEAVIFDWGGTLTPWHEVDLASQWYAYAEAYDPERAASLATELLAAEQHLYQRQRHTAGALGCGTLDAMFVDLGIDIHSARHLVALESYLEFWRPHTYAHPDAAELLAALRNLGLRVGVLSNTMWPREHHEAVFARDELLSLIDAAVYTSELPVGKPHESAFRAILDQLGVARTERFRWATGCGRTFKARRRSGCGRSGCLVRSFRKANGWPPTWCRMRRCRGSAMLPPSSRSGWPEGALLRVVIAGLQDDQIVTVDQMDEAMFLVDPSRPRAGQQMLKWLRLPDPCKGRAKGVLDKSVDPGGSAPIAADPVLVVVPCIVREDESHGSTRSRSVALPLRA